MKSILKNSCVVKNILLNSNPNDGMFFLTINSPINTKSYIKIINLSSKSGVYLEKHNLSKGKNTILIDIKKRVSRGRIYSLYIQTDNIIFKPKIFIVK